MSEIVEVPLSTNPPGIKIQEPVGFDDMRKIEAAILAHERGEGPEVDRPLLRAALNTIRGSASTRAANSATATKGKAAASIPLDLGKLFGS